MYSTYFKPFPTLETERLILRKVTKKDAKDLYEYIITECKKLCPVVEKGVFGADMKVELLNDGPFTVVLDSKEL